jgi:hypothetical protein
MDQIIVIAWGSIEFLLCPLLFFFFSFLFLFLFFYFSQIICKMENHLTNKNTKEITFESPVDPINYRVITPRKIVLAELQPIQDSGKNHSPVWDNKALLRADLYKMGWASFQQECSVEDYENFPQPY